MFIDSHCHLDRLDLSNYQGNLDLAIKSATDAMVSHMLCVGIDLNNAPTMLELAKKYKMVFASVGIHPSDCQHQDDVLQLIPYLSHPKIVALGETGLDFFYEKNSDQQQIQQKSFIQHLTVASEHKLPIIVHSRNARTATLDLIRNYGCQEVAGVLHCFTESLDMATKAMDMNYMISISGIVTFKKAIELQEIVKHIPLDRLLIETDAPFLAPVPHRGKPNEPKYLPDTATYIANLKGISVEKLAEITSNNFFKLFTKADKHEFSN